MMLAISWASFSLCPGHICTDRSDLKASLPRPWINGNLGFEERL